MALRKSTSDAVIALNQAFLDHVREEEKRFQEIAVTLKIVGSLDKTLGLIELQLRGLKAGVDEIDKNGKIANGRIGKLENWRASIHGAFFVVGVIIGAVAPVVIKTIFH